MLLLDKLPRSLGHDKLSGEDELTVSQLRLPDLPDGSFGGFIEPKKAPFPQVGHSVDKLNERNGEIEFDNPVSQENIEIEHDEPKEGDASPSLNNIELQGDYNFYEVLYGLCERKAGQPVSTALT